MFKQQSYYTLIELMTTLLSSAMNLMVHILMPAVPRNAPSAFCFLEQHVLAGVQLLSEKRIMIFADTSRDTAF